MKKTPSPLLRILVCFVIYVLMNQSGASADIMFGSMKVDRILYLGNSMTWCGPNEEVGWPNAWGMAATAEEKDYVHVLTNSIAQTAGETPEIMVKNIYGFERLYLDPTFDINAELQAELAFQPDVVVMAIGENVASLDTPEAQAAYTAAFQNLLQTLKNNSNPTIFVRSCFWNNENKDAAMEQGAINTGSIYVDISDLNCPLNRAESEGVYTHPGVAAHPGDRGMAAIAGALYDAMETYAVPEPSSLVLLSMGALAFLGIRRKKIS